MPPQKIKIVSLNHTVTEINCCLKYLPGSMAAFRLRLSMCGSLLQHTGCGKRFSAPRLVFCGRRRTSKKVGNWLNKLICDINQITKTQKHKMNKIIAVGVSLFQLLPSWNVCRSYLFVWLFLQHFSILYKSISARLPVLAEDTPDQPLGWSGTSFSWLWTS